MAIALSLPLFLSPLTTPALYLPISMTVIWFWVFKQKQHWSELFMSILWLSSWQSLISEGWWENNKQIAFHDTKHTASNMRQFPLVTTNEQQFSTHLRTQNFYSCTRYDVFLYLQLSSIFPTPIITIHCEKRKVNHYVTLKICSLHNSKEYFMWFILKKLQIQQTKNHSKIKTQELHVQNKTRGKE